MICLKLLKVLAPCLIGAVIAGGAAWKIQSTRIASRDTDIKRISTQLATCQDVNKTSQDTVTWLGNEIKEARKGCESRMRIKETTLGNIRRIDQLSPQTQRHGRLPYQSKAAAYKRLETYGLVEHVEITLPGKLPIIVPGWILTHKGRMAYCESCKGE